MIKYTNSSYSGYDIAERFHFDFTGRPSVIRRAWFADRWGAENYMREAEDSAENYIQGATDSVNRNRRIIDCSTGRIVRWRGVSGIGENAITLEQWLAFEDMKPAQGV